MMVTAQDIRDHINPLERATVFDKTLIKEFLQTHTNLRTPKTYKHLPYSQVDSTMIFDNLPNEFVMKPNRGGQGRGVFVLKNFTEPNGTRWLKLNLFNYIRTDIRYRSPFPYELRRPWFGDKFFQARTGVMFEELIHPHPTIGALSRYGTMPDFRFYFLGRKHWGTIMRIPTKISGGYANTSRGGIAVNVVDGVVRDDIRIRGHDRKFDGFEIPGWDNIVKSVGVIPTFFESLLVSIDGTIGEDGEFVVIEVEVNPKNRCVVGKTEFGKMVAGKKVGKIEGWIRGKMSNG